MAVADTRLRLDDMEAHLDVREAQREGTSSLCLDLGACACGHPSTGHNVFSGECLDLDCGCRRFEPTRPWACEICLRDSCPGHRDSGTGEDH